MHASTRHIMYVRISVKFFLDAWAFAACGFSKAWQLYTTYATQQLDFCCKKKLLQTCIVSLLLGAIFQVDSFKCVCYFSAAKAENMLENIT